MDAKFERSLKSLNFRDDYLVHPTIQTSAKFRHFVEQYLKSFFCILIGLYQNLKKPWKGLLHNLYATHKHLLGETYNVKPQGAQNHNSILEAKL